jgi:hypothetical protein
MQTFANDDERAAHDAILRWCRRPEGSHGARCMRNGNPGDSTCLVVNVNGTEPRPGGKGPHDRRTIRIGEGTTWIETLANLREKGHTP